MARIYIDSCLIIYLIERNASFYGLVANAMRRQDANEICISPLVKLECLVAPLRREDQVLQQRYRNFFGTVTSLPIPEAVYEDATTLRARYHLKTPDALHLAVALRHGCEELWTNDDRLAKAAGKMAINKLAS
ncbi:MAG: type II toxin-antitoxin system VapC family toxin [Proteobacteria bacterium]|nr:type II toxin-antitoxin system VapC family toxin [Pseudomonadota bacterium]